MRIGLRLEGHACHGVMAAGAAVVETVAVTDAGSLVDAADQALEVLRRTGGAAVTEITFDVGRVLTSRPLSNVAVIRISPRPPADSFHTARLPRIVEGVASRIVHVRGGHDIRAHELASLDLAGFMKELPSIVGGHRNVAITALGSTSTDVHEARIADAILAYDSGVGISISHDFFANAFQDRDFTTTLNSALMETGEYLATALEQLCRRHFPGAEPCFVKNDGGKARMRQLAATPVHALHSEPASRLLGLALLTGEQDAEIVMVDDMEAAVGAIRGGIPASTSRIKMRYEARLASNAAAVVDYTANYPLHPLAHAIVADLRKDRSESMPFGLDATISTDEDAALLGCAAAPWTAWIDRLESVANKEDLQRVQRLAEEDAKSIVIQSGASPEFTKIMESNAYALPYGNPGIVRVRVQAAERSGQGIGVPFSGPQGRAAA